MSRRRYRWTVTRIEDGAAPYSFTIWAATERQAARYSLRPGEKLLPADQDTNPKGYTVTGARGLNSRSPVTVSFTVAEVQS